MANVTLIKVEKIPDGVYAGRWSAYCVTCDVGEVRLLLTVDIGVRGLDVPCQVEVKDGRVTVT